MQVGFTNYVDPGGKQKVLVQVWRKATYDPLSAWAKDTLTAETLVESYTIPPDGYLTAIKLKPNEFLKITEVA